MRPERIVHIGLGAFFRAHQAWFTEHASDADQWGIVAYTGRSATQAELLNAQNCRYSLVIRGKDDDQLETISSVVRAEAGSNLEDLKITLSRPEIAIVTLTITEAGYQPSSGSLEEQALGRLVLALDARRLSCGEPLALVPCDNLPSNGEVLRSSLMKLGEAIGPEFLDYLATLSFVTTSVDRITPKTTEADVRFVLKQQSFMDRTPVVTEPFKDWVLEGGFPLGRPNWESAGARFVSEIEPFENRKLWLLNGAHSLMAYVGLGLGLETVDQAIQNPQVRELVEKFWDEACHHLDAELLNLNEYRNDLLERFQNPRIGYKLIQIAQDGLNKFSVRLVPVAIREIESGRHPQGSLTAIMSWFQYVKNNPDFIDSRKLEIQEALESVSSVEAFGKLLPISLIRGNEALLTAASIFQ